MLAPDSRYVTPLLRPKDAPILAVPSTFLHTSTRYHRELGTIEQSARCSRLLVPRTLTPVTQPLGIATVSLGCNQEIHPSPGCCRVEGVERPNRKKKYTSPVAPGIFQGRKKRELEARWPKMHLRKGIGRMTLDVAHMRFPPLSATTTHWLRLCPASCSQGL